MTAPLTFLSAGCERSTEAAAVLARLRQELTNRGLDRKTPIRICAELLWHVSVATCGILITFSADTMFWRAVGLLISTLGSMGVGTNTHTSSHYATSNKRWVNEALTFFGYPFFLGLSATFWWRKHLVVHHPAPNVIGVDEDADFTPWLALTELDVSHSKGVRRFYYERMQWPLFPLLLAANGFNMQLSGWRYLIKCITSSSARRRAHWIDLCCLVLHSAVNLGMPLLVLAPDVVITSYAVRITLMGYAMFAVLGPGHLPVEAARLTSEHDVDHLMLQTSTTANFRTGPVGRLLCSGLQYQIEHHLFPSLSHVHYPAVSGIVEDFCRRQRLPYRTHSWPVALWKCWSAIGRPAGVYADVEHLRPRL